MPGSTYRPLIMRGSATRPGFWLLGLMLASCLPTDAYKVTAAERTPPVQLRGEVTHPRMRERASPLDLYRLGVLAVFWHITWTEARAGRRLSNLHPIPSVELLSSLVCLGTNCSDDCMPFMDLETSACSRSLGRGIDEVEVTVYGCGSMRSYPMCTKFGTRRTGPSDAKCSDRRRPIRGREFLGKVTRWLLSSSLRLYKLRNFCLSDFW